MALERIQASVARFLLLAGWSTPKEQVLEELDWPSLRWSLEIASMVLFHNLQTRPPPLARCLFSFSTPKKFMFRRQPYQLLLSNAK